MSMKKSVVKLLSVILIGFLLNHCYRVVEVPREQPIYTKGKVVKLIWEDPSIQEMYMLDNSIEESKLVGLIHSREFYSPPKKLTQIVNVYVDTTLVPPGGSPVQYSIPINAIKKIEVYDSDIGKTIALVILGTAAIVGIVFLIILLTKESCPFVYAYNGESFEFTGEIYSGAIFPHLERDDYLPLPPLKPLENEYQLKMTNEVQEIQYTNLTELLVIDHPAETDVLLDKYGNYHTFDALQSPRSAHNSNQLNILPELMEKDNLKYLGDVNEDTELENDFIILNFEKPAEVENAELVLRAKNSFWLDYIFGQFFNMFGDEYPNWMENQRNLKEGKNPNWSLEQGIPLSVYLEKNGEWQFVDYYNVVGPMAEKDIIMSLDIADIDSNDLNVKLEFGYMFWELDYAGIDFSPQLEVDVQTMDLNSAIDHNGEEVSGLLKMSDDVYFVMDEIGDQALLKFTVPEGSQTQKRSVFLHSRGHYEVIRDPIGTPNLSYLKSFREPGSFGRFSKERFLEFNERFID